MKILAAYGTKREKVYIINTFNPISANIHIPTDTCTIIHNNGEMENVPFRDVTIIDKEYLGAKASNEDSSRV